MNKQEFLAFSLPYGLKTINVNYIEEDILIIRDFLSIDFNGNIKVDGIVMPLNCNITAHKPILHPLSDLTKEIDHNGKKFVPMVELAKISYPERYVSLFAYRDGIIKAEIDFEDYYVHLYFDGKDFVSDSSIQNQFKLFQKLIEWHFDIAGLIEKGEAIDVNTLSENPYK